MNRSATAVFGLIYPAVLGTLLFGLFQNPASKGSSSLLAVLLICYFVLQYVQGQAAAEVPASQAAGQEHRGYLWGDAVADLAEVATMLAAFAVLGFFGDPAVRSEQTAAILTLLPACLFETRIGQGLVLAAVFLLPPLVRIVDRHGARQGWWPQASPTTRPSHLPGHSRFLTVMSAFAAVGAALQPLFGNWMLILIGVPLLAYWALYLAEDRPRPN